MTDSTGTLYSESADWLKKNLSEKMWKRFRWEASEIFTKYHGHRLRVVSQRWGPQSKPGSAAPHRGAQYSTVVPAGQRHRRGYRAPGESLDRSAQPSRVPVTPFPVDCA